MKKKYKYIVIIFLIVASFIAYGRILGNDFVKFDDNEYIFENHHIKSGINVETIKWAFTATVSNHWHPLTLLSHTLDWSLFGANASGHHLISLLLHIGAVLFLFLFLEKTTKSFWSSVFVAAFFALHPLRVESVAWAAGRKDVLSMFFGMASLYVYALYARDRRLLQYFCCLILFTLGLLAKSILVTLPFVFMLIDYWPLGRWQKALQKEISAPVKGRDYSTSRLLWEKAPFIIVAVFSGILTIWAQNKGEGIITLQELPFVVRLSNAVHSYVSYLGKTFWPVDLAILYPYESSFPFWQILASCFIMIGISIVVIYSVKKKPFLFVGWFWYLGTLVPVIGLLQVCGQPMADRYTYLPSIGIAIMLAWGTPLLFQSEKMRKKILFPAGTAVLAILAVLTWQQCGYWKNSYELFNHTLNVTKNNYIIHINVGRLLLAEGKIDEAIDHYNKAVRIIPDYPGVYGDRGSAYAKLGRYQLAIDDYNKAISLKPDSAEGYYNRGTAYAESGQYQLAVEDFNKAIILKQNYADIYDNRGITYAKLGRYQSAIEDFNKAIRLQPDDSGAYINRGTAYTILGRYQPAIEDFKEAIHLNPENEEARQRLNLALERERQQKL